VAAAGLALLPTATRAAEAVPRRLRELGIELPEVPAPVANYVPWVRENGFVYLAGQIPFLDGELMSPGKVPVDVSIEAGRAAARQCGINLIAALNAACEGDLNKVRRCMRLDGFVASSPGFNQQPAVVNGASDLMVEVFGDAGRHSRTAVGVNELPLNACVEVAAVFVIDE
jgi:enamine deaminase RidA (YjgF/YER057c/UK114 family)